MKHPANLNHRLYPIVSVHHEMNAFHHIELPLREGLKPRFDEKKDPFWIIPAFGVFFRMTTSIQGSTWSNNGVQCRKNMETNEWEFI